MTAVNACLTQTDALDLQRVPALLGATKILERPNRRSSTSYMMIERVQPAVCPSMAACLGVLSLAALLGGCAPEKGPSDSSPSSSPNPQPGAAGGGAGGSSGGQPIVSNPPAYQPAAGMLRRLTRTQFRNAVRDVFGVEVDTSQLEADSWNGNFAVIGAVTVTSSERGVEQYHAAIEKAVDAVFGDRKHLHRADRGETVEWAVLALRRLREVARPQPNPF